MIAWPKIVEMQAELDSSRGEVERLREFEFGQERVVKMLLEPNDVRPAMADNKNQTPLSPALPEGPDGAARILLARNNVDLDQANHSGQASLPPFPGPADELAVEAHLRPHDPDSDIIDFSAQTELLRAAHNERPTFLALQDSISESAGRGSSIEPPRWSRHRFFSPRRLLRRRRKAKTDPNNA